jgi:hypothetical protein
VKIQVYDDGKGKWQSFEARLEIEPEDTPFYYLLPEVHGFGADADAAVTDLQGKVGHIIETLQGVDWTQTPVQIDARGRPIEGGG